MEPGYDQYHVVFPKGTVDFRGGAPRLRRDPHLVAFPAEVVVLVNNGEAGIGIVCPDVLDQGIFPTSRALRV